MTFFAKKGPQGTRETLALISLAVVWLFQGGGCATKRDPTFSRPAEAAQVEGVPFFPQTQYECGPASLAGVLNFYGDMVNPDEIADAVYRRNIRGTVSLDMVLYARRRGFSSSWHEGSVEDMTKALDADHPLIVMVDLGFSPLRANHYMVIIGYDSEGIIANTGTTPGRHIAWGRFLSQWQKTQNWTLLIVPRSSVSSE